MHPDLDRARDMQKAGQFAEAEAQYVTILEQSPNDPDALHLFGILLHQTGRSDDGVSRIKRALETEPERTDIRMNLGVILSQSGRIAEGIQELERVWRDDPTNEAALRNLVSLLQVSGRAEEAIGLIEGRTEAWVNKALYHLYGTVGRYKDAVAVGRAVLAATPGDTSMRTELRKILPLADVRAEAADLFPTRQNDAAGRHIVVAGMRKSASTFVANMLVHLTGYADVSLADGFNLTYDFISREQLEAVYGENTVSHAHCPAHEENLQIFEALNIVPVVVTRNVFDNARSYMDWRRKTNFPHETVYKDCKSFSDDQWVDFLIDTYIVRQLEFYASWADVEKTGRLPFVWAPYDAMIEDKPAFFGRILDGIGMPMDAARIEQGIALVETQNDSRFNAGVSGRGRDLFDSAAKARVQGMTRYFPGVDFRPLGL